MFLGIQIKICASVQQIKLEINLFEPSYNKNFNEFQSIEWVDP